MVSTFTKTMASSVGAPPLKENKDLAPKAKNTRRPWYAGRLPVGIALHLSGMMCLYFVPLTRWVAWISVVFFSIPEFDRQISSRFAKGEDSKGVSTIVNPHNVLWLCTALDIISVLWLNSLPFSPTQVLNMMVKFMCLRSVCMFIYLHPRNTFVPQLSLTEMSNLTVIDIITLLFIMNAFSSAILIMFFSRADTLINLLSIVVNSDSLQYFGGVKFGLTIAFPTISPKKTIEGYVLGFILSVIFGLLTCDHVSPFFMILFTCNIIVGWLGDLLISAWKRSHTLKDTSSILAAHGGLLDRFDSHFACWIFTAMYLSCSSAVGITVDMDFMNTNLHYLAAATVLELFLIAMKVVLTATVKSNATA